MGGDKLLPSLLSLKVDPPDQLNNEGVTDESGEVILAQALEEVLALKNLRERELAMEDTSNVDAAQNKVAADYDDNVVGVMGGCVVLWLILCFRTL